MKTKWEYYTTFIQLKVSKKGGLFTKQQKEWSITIEDKEMELQSGLDYMGAKGWELVALQKAVDYHGGTTPDWNYVPILCIFKSQIS